MILSIIFHRVVYTVSANYMSEQPSRGAEKRELCRIAKNQYYFSNFTANYRYLQSTALQKKYASLENNVEMQN